MREGAAPPGAAVKDGARGTGPARAVPVSYVPGVEARKRGRREMKKRRGFNSDGVMSMMKRTMTGAVIAAALAIAGCIGGEGVAPEAPPAGTTFRGCPECPEMVVVPAGRFEMGSPWGGRPVFLRRSGASGDDSPSVRGGGA